MNRKILSFFLSLIFLFEIPTAAFAKNVNNNKNVNKKTSSTLQESTISVIFSKIKNNISSILYTAITTGIVSFDLYLLYALLFNTNQHQSDDHSNNDRTKSKNYRNVATNFEFSMYSSAITDKYKNKGVTNEAPIRGIQNVGVSCYINSAIQQLYGIDKFRNHILSQQSIDKTKQPFTWAIYYIFCAINQGIPMCKNNLSECLQMLGYKGKQEDSVEFMKKVIDRCSRETKQDKSNIIDICDFLYVTDNESNTCNLLGLLRSAAPINGKVIEEEMNKSHPGLNPGSSEYREKVDGLLSSNNDNPDYHMEPTFQNNDGTYIIIPINRTQQSEFVPCNKPGHITVLKNSAKISIPMEITDNGKTYILSCVTVHHGRSGNSGHYLVYKKTVDGKWLEINDSCVKEVKYSTIKEDIGKNCTLLTYSNKQ